MRLGCVGEGKVRGGGEEEAASRGRTRRRQGGSGTLDGYASVRGRSEAEGGGGSRGPLHPAGMVPEAAPEEISDALVHRGREGAARGEARVVVAAGDAPHVRVDLRLAQARPHLGASRQPTRLTAAGCYLRERQLLEG